MAKVLVIDDDPGVRQVIRNILEEWGHEAFEAENGREGVDAITRTRFSVVICDMVMPVQEGVETIQQIRALDPVVPLIAISGVFAGDDSSLMDRARMMGADTAVAKPFGAEELLTAIDDVLDRRLA